MFEERVVLENGFFLEAFQFLDKSYRISCGTERQILVEYKGEGNRHSRSLRGRAGAYAFKSVEQLRYDFERDAEDALRQG